MTEKRNKTSQLTNIEKILLNGEGITVEFKRAKNELPSSLFETGCAFLNRYGGDILIGINDRWEVEGIDSKHIQRFKKEIVNALNNPQLINPPVYIVPDEVEIDEKRVLHLHVYESLQVHSTRAKIFDRNEDGLTLADILLFGRDDVILSALPFHKTDAICRIENTDRYDDRLDIRTNVIESYDRLMQFVEKHLPDKFVLWDDVRIIVRNLLFREVISNTLIHREYTNPYPAKFIIENNRISRREMAEKLKINESAIQKHINKLKQLRILERIGETRGYWKVNNNSR